MADNTLLFAYDALLDPDTLYAVAPGAQFLFVAHYPETRLAFVAGPEGVVPTLVKDPANTVWGAVFEVDSSEADAIVAAAAREGRAPGLDDQKTVDREGNKHDCLTIVASASGDENVRPSPQYLERLVRGAKHWNLPAGWVMGLEDLAEDSLSA